MLLYDSDEGEESIYLIDMGEAKLSTKSTINRGGTVLYMAPERNNSATETGTHQSDIW